MFVPTVAFHLMDSYLDTDVVNVVGFIKNNHAFLLQLTGHHLGHLHACIGVHKVAAGKVK